MSMEVTAISLLVLDYEQISRSNRMPCFDDQLQNRLLIGQGKSRLYTCLCSLKYNRIREPNFMWGEMIYLAGNRNTVWDKKNLQGDGNFLWREKFKQILISGSRFSLFLFYKGIQHHYNVKGIEKKITMFINISSLYFIKMCLCV